MSCHNKLADLSGVLLTVVRSIFVHDVKLDNINRCVHYATDPQCHQQQKEKLMASTEVGLVLLFFKRGQNWMLITRLVDQVTAAALREQRPGY